MVGWNKRYLILIAVVVFVAGMYWLWRFNTRPAAADEWQVFDTPAAETYEKPEAPVDQTIKIYITGAVENPDVYELPQDSRVADAVEAAGGATSEAALEAINLSARIADEDHIIVPRLGEEMKETIISVTGGTAAVTDTKVNINTATSAELQTLPGIGPVTAERIITYREEHDGFLVEDELKQVERIGAKTYEAIEDLITVE